MRSSRGLVGDALQSWVIWVIFFIIAMASIYLLFKRLS